MAVALRGPDAESWLTNVRMIDSASVRVDRKRRQLMSRRRLTCGGLMLFLGLERHPFGAQTRLAPHNRGVRQRLEASAFGICWERQLRRNNASSSWPGPVTGSRRKPGVRLIWLELTRACRQLSQMVAAEFGATPAAVRSSLGVVCVKFSKLIL